MLLPNILIDSTSSDTERHYTPVKKYLSELKLILYVFIVLWLFATARNTFLQTRVFFFRLESRVGSTHLSSATPFIHIWSRNITITRYVSLSRYIISATQNMYLRRTRRKPFFISATRTPPTYRRTHGRMWIINELSDEFTLSMILQRNHSYDI